MRLIHFIQLSNIKTLRLTSFCSDNSNFDKQGNELESWLLEKGYSEKIVRKQVLRVREHSRKSLFEKVKSESDQKKLAFNITYYPVFQNVRNILQELHILLTPYLLQHFVMVKV